MKSITVGDACELIVDCPHSTPTWTKDGVLVFRSHNIRNGRLDLTNRSYTTEAHYAERTRRATPSSGDIIITREAPMGQVAMIPEGVRGCLGQRLVLLRPNRSVVIPEYMLYALISPPVQNQIGAHEGTGSTVSNLRIPALRSLAIPLPQLRDQLQIARTLSSLDNKIDLNRKMNETLEAMARAIFRSWFVDFDPVKAKAEGRQPAGMDAETAALFPNRFVDSELGPIPEGWTVRPLDEIADYQNGLALQNFRPQDDEPRLPVIKIAQLRTGEPDSGEWARANIKPECILDDGDVVFSWSGSLTVVLWCAGRAALNQHLFRVTSREFPRWFYLLWTLAHLPDFQAIAADKATTMGHIKRHHLHDARCVVPPTQIIENATRLLEPLVERQVHCRRESRVLAELRDTLLPKLISGELRIDGAEAAVEAVA